MKTPAEAWSLFQLGDRVGLAGAGGEPRGALAALADDPERGRGLDFAGIWLPGVNEFDPSALAPESSAEAIFVTPALREGFQAGRVKLMPLAYWHADRWLSGPARLTGAIMQVTPPQDGFVTPGIACDFDQALLDGAATLVGEVNPRLPTPPSAPRIPVERFALLTEAETDLPGYAAGALPEDLRAVAGRIVELIRPGDTVQVGIGKAAAAVLEALVDHRGLSYHAGLIIDEFAPLFEAGVFSGSVVTGTFLGSPALYERLGAASGITLKPARHTHDQRVISAIPGFKAINSALSIDLFGQATQEMLGGRQISGQGGVADFTRGARASEGGQAILALPATARRGTQSRIRPRLEPDGVVSLARAEADVVVTEFGVADLRWLDLDSRAQALIAIAAPQFRDELADEWDAMRRAM